jgi:hypothetical protein
MVVIIKCRWCNERFSVPRVDYRVPKHAKKVKKEVTGFPYIPCPGSNGWGIPIDIKSE